MKNGVVAKTEEMWWRESPFVGLLSTLEEYEANYVFSGRIMVSGKEYKVQNNCLDLISGSLLVIAAFHFERVAEAYAVKNLGAMSREVRNEERRNAEIEEEVEKIDQLEFALLWNWPGKWEPRLIQPALWDDARVYEKMCETATLSVTDLTGEAMNDNGISITGMPAAPIGKMIERRWNQNYFLAEKRRAQEDRDGITKRYFNHRQQ
ncbi:hypothetical protein [Rubinisphaera brasiliensis]|uniref:Uncharacterized protein n=1 Tax=Rubinisphaera brasiliensis (strain ATCC 49424 / DSM 5305 / JCM 21570 / IAM 15109 / NBRC 103401 / IFAM 1448) TaxID=756272 RepID=F0SGF0_RUBBR|nr:hypothetical protein [Rubinisphaera brasiliensis]ADY60549.1 hypothetical protein Plabr_2950 [Rubinisphaera brasiliensis DSM 5305]